MSDERSPNFYERNSQLLTMNMPSPKFDRERQTPSSLSDFKRMVQRPAEIRALPLMRHTSGFDISKLSFKKRSEDMYSHNLLKHKIMKFHKQSSDIINSMMPELQNNNQNEYFNLQLSNPN